MDEHLASLGSVSFIRFHAIKSRFVCTHAGIGSSSANGAKKKQSAAKDEFGETVSQAETSVQGGKEEAGGSSHARKAKKKLG